MANEIRIHRKHALGLTKARKLAWAWAEQVERDYGMECTVIEGDGEDTVEFTRSGVAGRVIVAADHFDLQARLGLIVGAFSNSIEAEIEKQFDALLASGRKAKAASKKAAAKKR